jgi:spore photoproduct lyase
MFEIDRLTREVRERFPKAGPNKIKEVVRLVFEIGKRDRKPYAQVLSLIPAGMKHFPEVKSFLLGTRYPGAVKHREAVNVPLCEVQIDPTLAVRTEGEACIRPKKVFIERGARDYPLVRRFRELLPEAFFSVIPSYREFVKSTPFSAQAFNQRTENFFIVKEQYDFFKKCPCTPGVVACGYHNVNLGFGCPYDCSYCFLQNYTNAPGIVFPANIEDFFASFAAYPQGIRVGSGETADSLVYDHLTGFSPLIVDFFRGRQDSVFEFKTKSANIGLLLKTVPSPNIVVGWSVNPERIIKEEEHFTASLKDRLAAAGQCVKAGYKVAFHFDPVFHYPGWRKDYADLAGAIFERISPHQIAWISLGTLRMTAGQKKTIESRFPSSAILNEELFTAPDGKIRYAAFIRRDIYTEMLKCICHYAPEVPVYLCMEPLGMWKEINHFMSNKKFDNE